MYREIHECRGCGQPALQDFLDLGNVPLVDRLVDPSSDDPEPVYPLTVTFCSTCALVQLRHIVSAATLFDEDYPYYSSVSASWLAHCRRNALELISRRKLDSNSLVLEIASNDGYLLKNFCEHGIPVLGIEPTPGPADAAEAIGIPTRREFFGRELADQLVRENLSADVVCANNVLAHVPDLRGFLAGIRTVLKPDGLAVIEAPYVRDLVDSCEFDTIYHEHMSYYSVTSVYRALSDQGLILIDVCHLSTHGGSLRYYVSQQGDSTHRVQRWLELEHRAGIDRAEYYQGFAHRVSCLQRRIAATVQTLKDRGHRLAAYGAAAKGAILLNTSHIGDDVLDYVVDRNPHKQGKLMPGGRLPIVGPERLQQDPPDYLLLLPWNLKEEIVQQQAEFAERGGKFIVPIPDCEIL